jgi:hypothetical protein
MKTKILEILSGRKYGDANDRWNDRCVERLSQFYGSLSDTEKVRFKIELNDLVIKLQEPFAYLLTAARVIGADISGGVRKAAEGALRWLFSDVRFLEAFSRG